VKRGTVVPAWLDDGNWSASFGLSMLELSLALIGAGRVVPGSAYLRNFCSTGGLVEGRNRVAADFLDRTDGEWLFMVDADMGFAPDVVERLLGSADPYNRPVVGALCFALRRAGLTDNHAMRFRIVPTLYDFHELDDEIGFAPVADYPRGRAVKVAGTGAACLLVHRRALEKIRAVHGDNWFTPVTHPKGSTTFSEDLSFCVRLASADIPLYVHTGVKTSHDKGGIFLDEDAFDRQQALDAPRELAGV